MWVSEFQACQVYIVRPCLKQTNKQTNKQINKMKLGNILREKLSELVLLVQVYNPSY